MWTSLGNDYSVYNMHLYLFLFLSTLDKPEDGESYSKRISPSIEAPLVPESQWPKLRGRGNCEFDVRLEFNFGLEKALLRKLQLNRKLSHLPKVTFKGVGRG